MTGKPPCTALRKPNTGLGSSPPPACATSEAARPPVPRRCVPPAAGTAALQRGGVARPQPAGAAAASGRRVASCIARCFVLQLSLECKKRVGRARFVSAHNGARLLRSPLPRGTASPCCSRSAVQRRCRACSARHSGIHLALARGSRLAMPASHAGPAMPRLGAGRARRAGNEQLEAPGLVDFLAKCARTRRSVTRSWRPRSLPPTPHGG